MFRTTSPSNIEKRTPSSTSEEDNIFGVEKVIGKRIINNKPHYLLKWKDFDESFSSWEPKENIECDELIEQFELLLKGKIKQIKSTNDDFTSHQKRNLSTSTVENGINSEAGPSFKREQLSPPEAEVFEAQVLENGVDNVNDEETHKKDYQEGKDENEGKEGNERKIPERIVSRFDLSGHFMYFVK